MIASSEFFFPDSMNIRDVLTILGGMVVGLGAFFSLRERSKINSEAIKEILERLEVFDLGRTKFCVETLWVFQLRRGMVEAQAHDLGSEKSPFRLTIMAEELLAPLLPELRAYYKKIGGDQLGLVELSVALEAEFGESIVRHVCQVVKVTKSACMVIAIAMLRGISQATLTKALQDAEYNYATLKRLEPQTSGTQKGTPGSDEINLFDHNYLIGKRAPAKHCEGAPPIQQNS